MAEADEQEQQARRDYIKQHNIEDLIENLTQDLLNQMPQASPKEHWAHKLGLELNGRPTFLKNTHFDEAVVATAVPHQLLAKLFQAERRITSKIVPEEAIKQIINETVALLNCDRVSFFMYDKRIHMLVLNSSNSAVPIRVKPGQGIAGQVFESQDTVNIPDCYADSRFDQSFDKMTGYQTKHLLTMPVIDYDGECIGVMQCINKNADTDDPCNPPYFGNVDEILLENLTEHIAVALVNTELYRSAIVTAERANALLHMIQSLSQNLDLKSTVSTITSHAREVVQADRCTVYLVDPGQQELASYASDTGTEFRLPKSSGIAGECATQGQMINIEDCYEDERFNQDNDVKSGYETISMLAVPVLRPNPEENGTDNVLAVIQMINKKEFDGEIGVFDEEDEQVMVTFAQFLAPKLSGQVPSST